MRSSFSRSGLIVATACAVVLSACDGKKAGPSAPPTANLPATAPPPASSAAASPMVPVVPVASASAASPLPELLLDIQVPSTVGADKRPLLILLHGLANTGKTVVRFLGIPEIAAQKRFVYAAPEGALDSRKAQYWNASKACCDFDGTNLDHVGMLRRAVAKAKTHPNVDPNRIYVAGFSNGGFFAHRAACEIVGIAAIASVAGAGPAEGESCPSAGRVRVLEIHGDADKAVRFDGGRVLDKPTVPVHPGARATTDGWGKRNGCTGPAKTAGTIDFEDKLEGEETTVLRYPGCQSAVELWVVKGGSHYLASTKRGVEAVWGFLDAGNTK